MTIRQIAMERFSVASAKPFDQVATALAAAVGHPEMSSFGQNIAAANNFSEVEAVVNKAAGRSGLLEFMRFDLGQVVSKQHGPKTPRSLRFLIGNPVIMKQLLELVPDAGSYAPVTILIDERADGVHLSYDTMAGFLAPYNNPQALKIATDLDQKVVALLSAVAA